MRADDGSRFCNERGAAVSASAASVGIGVDDGTVADGLGWATVAMAAVSYSL